MDCNHFSSKLTNRIHLCILDISHNFEIAICNFALILLNYRLQGLSLLTISQTKSFVVTTELLQPCAEHASRIQNRHLRLSSPQLTQTDTIRQFRWSIDTVGTTRKLCHSKGFIGAKQVLRVFRPRL